MESVVRVGGLLAAYRIERLVGRGGMGVVYRAEHEHLRRTVALKIPSEEVAAQPGFRERFIRESRIAASIDHPNLVTIFDAGDAGGVLFLAMQFVEGGDLKRVLEREGRLPAVRAYAYLVQIAAALDAAHAHGLIHRDVKPGNVLIENERCYLTDFGLCKLPDASKGFTAVGDLVGTLQYVAPEQIRGSDLDRRADVYALGCLAFEMLVGAVPFDRDSAAATVYAHLMAPPPRVSERRPELPRAVDDVIDRVLAKDRGDRHETAGAFVEDLRAALGLRALTADRAATARRPAAGDGPRQLRLPLPRPLQAAAGSALVGREQELARLRERWAEVCDGARVAIALGGEAGIGKTRLAAELARVVHGTGALVLYGRCDEGLAAPYQPFVEALRPLAREMGVDRLRGELGGLAPELGRLWPELAGLGEPERTDPESERFALFEAVVALLAAATREQRVLLVLDDLHWAAKPTVLLLRHVVRSERSLGALVLGTYRDTEVVPGEPLVRLLADMYGMTGERVSVAGLDERAIAALLEQAAAPVGDGAAAELVQALGAQTGGNPFFIKELVANLVESGAIERIGERLSSGRAVALEAPEGVRQVIGHRIARLSASAQRVLAAAATAGPTFSFVLLERALGDEPEVLDALEEAVGGGLLIESEHAEFVFAHALVRETIYGELGSARRMRLHRHIGEALETLGDPRAQAEALGYHFAQAAADGQGVKAADYALIAGRRATARLGYEEAARHYERGLQALTFSQRPEPERRCELLLALSEARWGSAEIDAARQASLQAAELAEQLGDATRLARAALAVGGPLFYVAVGPVVELLERALAALGEEDSALRAQLMGRLSASFVPGVDARRAMYARRALQMARRVGDNAALADVLATTQLVTRGPDDLDERLEEIGELARVANEIADARLRAYAHEWLLSHHLEMGDIEAFDREFAALRHLSEARGDRYTRWLVTTLASRNALLQGRLEQCEALAHEALALAGGGRDEGPVEAFRAQMLCLRREQGRLDEMIDDVESAAREYAGMSPWDAPLCYSYVELGREAQARDALEALARAKFKDIARDALWSFTMAEFCEAVTFLGDAPRAELLYELLLPYADRCVVTLAAACMGSVSRSLGLVASTMTRYEEAAGHFEAALEMNARIKSPLWVAHTQHDYARMLLERRGPGDSDHAFRLLEQALATGKRLGLKALSDKARTLMTTGQVPEA